jgi:hypothetical protein
MIVSFGPFNDMTNERLRPGHSYLIFFLLPATNCNNSNFPGARAFYKRLFPEDAPNQPKT